MGEIARETRSLWMLYGGRNTLPEIPPIKLHGEGPTLPEVVRLKLPPVEMTATEAMTAAKEAEKRMLAVIEAEWREWMDDVLFNGRFPSGKYEEFLLTGEESTADILKEMGEKEEHMETLRNKKIKRVTIECEGGQTFTGKITRIEGCPFDISQLRVEAVIGAPTGDYGIEKVIFNDPATIVYWTDGTKTVVKCQDGDTYCKETGLAMCIVKKHFGNKGNYNDVFHKFIPEEKEEDREPEDECENKLLAAMKSLHMNSTELAEEIGVSERTIRRYIQENRIPESRLESIAYALDVDPEYFM